MGSDPDFSVKPMKRIPIWCLLGLFSVAQGDELPDWSGVWQRVEGNAGMFDVSTTVPPDGRAGPPGVRQHPPLTRRLGSQIRGQSCAGGERPAAGPDLHAVAHPPGFRGYSHCLMSTSSSSGRSRPGSLLRTVPTSCASSPTAARTSRRKIAGRHLRAIPSANGTAKVLEFTTISMVGENGTVLDRSGMTLSDQASVRTKDVPDR